MNETLISACTMFLVPATLLFGALGVANSSFLKMLVCLLGGATAGLWFYRVWWWTNLSLIDRRTALALGHVCWRLADNAVGAVEKHVLARLKPPQPKSCIRYRPFIGYHRVTLEAAEGWDRTECLPRP